MLFAHFLSFSVYPFQLNHSHNDNYVHYKKVYVCILRARVQPTLDPYAEAFIAGPFR